jgi:citrate lyase subunit beta/citryl-CoA lyase
MSHSNTSRRSWLIVPADHGDVVAYAEIYCADVTVLDLEYTVPPKNKDRARVGVAGQITKLAATGVEVFVRVDRATRWADVRAAVGRGLKGIVLPSPDDAADVVELAALITELEKERGVELGTTEIVLMFESAKSFWNADTLGRASARVSGLGVGRIDLSMMLGTVPQNEFRLYRFLMTRTLVAARMLGKQPLGAFWRPGSRGGMASVADTMRAAREARLLGFSGCVCASPEQVAPVNAGFAHS